MRVLLVADRKAAPSRVPAFRRKFDSCRDRDSEFVVDVGAGQDDRLLRSRESGGAAAVDVYAAQAVQYAVVAGSDIGVSIAVDVSDSGRRLGRAVGIGQSYRTRHRDAGRATEKDNVARDEIGIAVGVDISGAPYFGGPSERRWLLRGGNALRAPEIDVDMSDPVSDGQVSVSVSIQVAGIGCSSKKPIRATWSIQYGSRGLVG